MRLFWYGLCIVLGVLAVVNPFLFAVVCVGGSLVNAVVRDISSVTNLSSVSRRN